MDNSSNTPRLLEVAKEFNIGRETVVEFLTDKGFTVSKIGRASCRERERIKQMTLNKRKSRYLLQKLTPIT